MVDPHLLGQSGPAANEDPKGETVAISMEELLDRFSLQHVDILKLDIESAEKWIFASGYERWLPRIRLIIIELHDWLEPGCARIFFDAVNQLKIIATWCMVRIPIIENLDYRY